VTSAHDTAVLELRQYTLRPGRRDELIDLFERHFLAGQERVGAHVLGHFRDLGDPDRFVWLRGFRDMSARRAALEAFYSGDLWREHRDAANATMIDSDDVLLLRPAAAGAALAGGNGGGRGGLYGVTIWPLAAPTSPEEAERLAGLVAETLAETGATLVATFVTEPAENDYPALPVREGENVLVALARAATPGALDTHDAALARLADARLAGAPQTLRLAPAPRSVLA
jgi:hypothetical protein